MERGPKALNYINGEEKGRGKEKEGGKKETREINKKMNVWYLYYLLTISYNISSAVVAAHIQSHA